MTKLLSIQNVAPTNADGIVEAMKEVFEKNFWKNLNGLNDDGASVNMGIHAGVGAKLREAAPWLLLVLPMTDAFRKSPIFDVIDTMLLKLYYYYQKTPKLLAEHLEILYTPKPLKAHVTRWIDHKYRAMKLILENYGLYMQHMKQLSDYLSKWTQAVVPLHLEIYLDLLAPLRQFSLSLQQEEHDPLKAIRMVKSFSQTIANLKLLIDESLKENIPRLTNYAKFLEKVDIYSNARNLKVAMTMMTTFGPPVWNIRGSN